MHYIIDGYNLLFRFSSGDEDLQAEREKVIVSLNSKLHFLGNRASLVFDAHHQIGDLKRLHRTDALDIFFTSHKETADDYILHFLASQTRPSSWTVVTSDRKLAWFARRSDAKTQSVEQFMALIKKRCLSKVSRLKREARRELPIAKPAKKAPALEMPPEASFEYYLEAFQEREVEEELPKKKRGKTLIKKKKQPHLPDGERWLQAFERKESDFT